MSALRSASRALGVAAGLALGGCVAVGSQPSDVTGEGVAYHLPSARVMLTASLNEARDTLFVEASEPAYVPDEAHGYMLRTNFSPSNAETLNVQVTPEGFITTIGFESEGRLDEAAVEAAKSAAALFESDARAANRVILFEEMIDPERLATDPAAARELNSRLGFALASMRTAGAKARELNALKRAPQPVAVSVERLYAPAAPDTVARGARDCAEGVCYRRISTYALRLRFADGVQRMVTFGAPNGSPTYVAPIDRGLFTTWKTNLTLQNGVLTAYSVNSGSELVEAAALPGRMVGGVIAGLTQRGQLFNSRATLIDAETKLIETRAAAAEKAAAARQRLEEARRLESVVERPRGMLSVAIGAEAGKAPPPRMAIGGFGAAGLLPPGEGLDPLDVLGAGGAGERILPSNPGE
jgi:hypothetical protein